jgi:hypothetical protein
MIRFRNSIPLLLKQDENTCDEKIYLHFRASVFPVLNSLPPRRKRTKENQGL